jgi:quinol monooxygenase YgiN
MENAMLGRPTDEDALRLVVAFYCIMEPEKRAELLRLAEQFARTSPVVEGCTHFLMLNQD